MLSDVTSLPWHRLQGLIAPLVLAAPKTGGDPQTGQEWPQVHERSVNFLLRNAVGKPWANQLTLLAAVMTAQRCDVSTVQDIISLLHRGFAALFPALGLERWEEWNPDQHLLTYLKGEIVPQHSQRQRTEFWWRYGRAARRVNDWHTSLPQAEQSTYEQFLLPRVNRTHFEGVIKAKEVHEAARADRKTEADAVVPLFADLRAQAHLRMNQLGRLRQAYQQALEQIERLGAECVLPLTFHYEEGADPEQGVPAAERFTFRVWDQRSFVLAHPDGYGERKVVDAQKKRDTFADQHRAFFLELTNVERLVDTAPAQEFWFSDLVRLGMLGTQPTHGTPEEVAAKQQWLQAWGYGQEKSRKHSAKYSAPFYAQAAGLLNWGQQGNFLAAAQDRTKNMLFLVEPLYAAALFGLLAVNLFTTTGMRINEAMQVRTSSDCLVRLVMPPSPGAKDQTPRVRYLLRLIPKGDRTNKPQNYYIGNETKRLLVKVGHMLQEHYRLQAGTTLSTLPKVPFSIGNGRAHRFGPAPYLFQYYSHHLSDHSITACMRFLLHGMVFRTQEGQMVTIKAHLLRHAFATHAVQVEKIPVDIVGAWLKQKHLAITHYYSEVTESMAGEVYERYLVNISTAIDVGEAVIRSPEHLQRLYESARGRVGTLAEVIGGECVDDHLCPIKFQCIGCPAKVPNPAKRTQIERRYTWTLQQIQEATEEGLLPEAERLKQHARDCATELREMDQIEAYRRDEQRVPQIHIEPQA